MPAKACSHEEDEVGLILNDIRDTLLPQINPNCTFTSRRQDKRLQERLIELSDECESGFTNLVYSGDLDGTAHGWGDVKPYPKYIERPKGHKVEPQKRRNTLPVDSSTIVRHLQERIQKWASRKPDRSYGTRTYRTFRAPTVESQKGSIKVPLINSIDLSSSSRLSDNSRMDDSSPNQAKSNKKTDKLDVNWNILSQNDAAFLNMTTYGLDPTCTYVPARKVSGSSAQMNNYTASKQLLTENKQTRSRGVLHPARQRSHMVKRLPKCKEVTIDLPEDAEECKVMMAHTTKKVAAAKKKNFKCSICIEGLQVADWPPDFEYNPGESGVPKIGPFLNLSRNAIESESLQDYKRQKSLEESEPDFPPSTIKTVQYPPQQSNKVTYSNTNEHYPASAPTIVSSTNASIGKSSYHKLHRKIVIKDDRARKSADKPRKGKPSLHTGSTTLPKRNISKTQQLNADHNSIMLNGTCTLETSSRILKRLSDCDRDESPLTLFDRFQASRSRDGTRGERNQPKISVKLNKKTNDKRGERKMLGVSICDIFTRSASSSNRKKRTELLGPSHDGDFGIFDCEILFDTAESSDLNKPKLDPIMHIRPLYIN